MLKKIFIMLIILLNSYFGYSLGCVYRGYEIEKNDVYYVNGSTKKKLQKADYKTFKIVRLSNYNLLARDKNNLYFQGEIVDGVDPNTYLIKKVIPSEEKDENGYICGSGVYELIDGGKEYILKEK